MKNIIKSLCIFILVLFSACEQEIENNIQAEIKLDIESLKVGYQEQFQNLHYFGKYVETPLWDKYELKSDITGKDSYYQIPYEQVDSNIVANLEIRIYATGNNYLIRLHNKSASNEDAKRSSLVYNVANNDYMTIGFRDEKGYFVKTDEIHINSQVDNTVLRSLQTMECGDDCSCHLFNFCICDIIDGCSEIIITSVSIHINNVQVTIGEYCLLYVLPSSIDYAIFTIEEGEHPIGTYDPISSHLNYFPDRLGNHRAKAIALIGFTYIESSNYVYFTVSN